MTILSWNIHRAYDLEPVSATLGAILGTEDPDLLLLQEVPVAARPFWEEPAVADLLAGFHLAFAPMHRVLRPSPYYPFRLSGQLTASRRPIADASVAPLPTVSRPKLGPGHRIARVALCTTIVVAGRELVVANLHLENTTGPGGRRLQVAHMLEQLPPAPTPVVVGGDLNTILGPLEGAIGELRRHGLVPAPVHGAPWLLPAIDRVFVRGATELSGRRLPGEGSDHRPVAACISF